MSTSRTDSTMALLIMLTLGLVQLLSGMWAEEARAEPRHAFVVTNESYSMVAISSLTFPHRDGELMSAALHSQGFNVRRLKDGSKGEFQRGLERFVQDVKAAGPGSVAFFYFSGHAAEDGTRNYFILSEQLPDVQQITGKPVEEVRSFIRSRLGRIGVPFRDVTAALAKLDTTARFVVIDSHLDMEEAPLFEAGQLLATQGRPGLNAADSNNYSLALSAALLTPGIDANAVFRQVQVKVAEVTNGRQIPFFVNKLNEHFVFNKGSQSNEGLRIKAEDDQWLEEPLWQSVNNTMSIQLLRVYLQRFPQGRHVDEARRQIEESSRLAAVAPSPAAGKTSALGRRVALVIGNSGYKNANYLNNPVNDAKAVADVLSRLGFEAVHQHFDLGREALLQSLKAFGDIAKGADWVVVYYAGHGMEVKGINYLIPVDAKLADEEDVEEEAVRMTRILDRMRDASGVKILILDACRDNPLAARMLRRGAVRSGGNKGLAEVQATSGTLIAYATNPGDAAFDGDGANSPYVMALLKHMIEPGQDVRIMFSAVYETVEQVTKGRQQPWFAAQLPGRPLVLRPN